MTDREDFARTIIYDAIASLLPTLGRDFNVIIHTSAKPDHRISTNAEIVPLTPIGKAIIPHIQAGMEQAIREVTKELRDNGSDKNDAEPVS